MALLLKHQTVAQFVTRFREAYRNAERERVVQLAKFILSSIKAGDITDVQCRTAFGMTAAQWTAVKTKMNNFINANNTVKSAIGE